MLNPVMTIESTGHLTRQAWTSKWGVDIITEGQKNKRELQGSQAILVQINIGSHTPKRYGIQLHHLEFTVIESGPNYLTSDALAFANTQPLQRLITNTLKTKRKAWLTVTAMICLLLCEAQTSASWPQLLAMGHVLPTSHSGLWHPQIPLSSHPP